LPCYSNVFTKSQYSSEDMALPEAIMNHVKQDTHHQNIYVIDSGLQSTRTMRSFSNDSATFIVRAKENRKHIELQSLLKQGQDLDLGELTLIKDSKVQLYTGKAIHNKKGNIHYREELVEIPFRFIKQELNVSHLVSLNKNGIEVMLYMTLIVAMLILIYKKANKIGYKTAKRRFKMELRNLAIAMIVVKCEGNLDHFET